MKENNEPLLEIKPFDQKNDSNKKEEDNDFFILYALPSLDSKRIKNGYIDCKSLYGDFKCATLHTLNENRDCTGKFCNYGIGYEVSEKDNVCNNYVIGDGWTKNNLNDVIRKKIATFSKDTKYQKIKYDGDGHETIMYLFNPEYKNKDKIQQKDNVKNISVGVMNDKMKNRISCVKKYLEDSNDNNKKLHDKKEIFTYSNKNDDSSFDENNYSIEENDEYTNVIAKYNNNRRVPYILANKQKNKIQLTLNEINFLKENQFNGKLKLKRICIYKSKLTNEYNAGNLQKQNLEIYNIARQNFPNEKIRIIDDDTGQMEFITPQVFKDRYCDNKYLEKINNNVYKDNQCPSCNIQ